MEVQVKKEAEQAWEADKDKEQPALSKNAARKTLLGSTKRVEQFRKNMRRWMIGRHSSSAYIRLQ